MDGFPSGMSVSTSMPAAFGEEQTASDPLELKLQTVVNFLVLAGNEIKVLSNSRCCSSSRYLTYAQI